MEITRSSLETKMGPSDWFTGNVYFDTIAVPIDTSLVSAAVVHFAPGARTAWHTHPNRHEVVIATKVHGRMHEGRNGAGLSRKAILSEIDKSLRRLGTDYVDLYVIHLWDYQTPVEETLEALHDVVQSGKARYLGASAMYAWRFKKALHVAKTHGWTRFVSMQNPLYLIYREEEREMLPIYREERIGVTPYSPLAAGRLTRD